MLQVLQLERAADDSDGRTIAFVATATVPADVIEAQARRVAAHSVAVRGIGVDGETMLIVPPATVSPAR
jgi:hypothetical protein